MAYGLEVYTSDDLLAFSNKTSVGWRIYETFVVGETSSSSKDYTGIIPAGFTIQAMVMPSAALGGSHTVSVSGYVVSWTYFTIGTGPPDTRNQPSTILVFFR